MVHLRQLQDICGRRLQIVFVYIRGAGHPPEDELKEFVEDERTPTEQRDRLARAGMKHYRLQFPCLLDDADDSVCKLYRAYPMRLLLLDKERRIVLDSGIPMSRGAIPWKQICDYINDPSSVSTLSPTADWKEMTP